MPRQATALFSGLILLSAAAWAAEIRGTVVTAAQNPVGGAVVLHRASGAKTETAADGTFSLKVPDGMRIALEVAHPDFYEREFLLGPRELDREVVLVLTALIKQNEEVIVTALRYPEPSMNVPAASAIVSQRQRRPSGHFGGGGHRHGRFFARPDRPRPGASQGPLSR
jgi:hypothetical protein